MKVSKRDFLKLLSGGTAVTAASVAAGSKIEPREPRPLTHEQVESVNPKLEPAPRAKAFEALWEPGTVFDIVDRIIYDRLQFRPGQVVAANLRFFSTPMWQPCPYTGIVKNKQHTNLCQAGRLSEPSMLWIRRIHLAIGPNADVESRWIAAAYAWGFWLGNKRYADGLVWTDAQLATISEVQKASLCPMRKSLELDASNGLIVPAGMCFSGEFHSDREHQLSFTGGGLDFMMVLEGVEARAVQ